MKKNGLKLLLSITLNLVLLGIACGNIPSTFASVVEPTKTHDPQGKPWALIASSDLHSCALSDVGTVYCWGYNVDGQLGIGNTIPQSIPQLVHLPEGVQGSITQIVVGHYHSCALSDVGAVYCWGYNFNGQLGIGNTIPQSTPQLVHLSVGVQGSITQIALGYSHSCALSDVGTVYCWGYNYDGQVGIGNTIPQSTPQLVHLPDCVQGSITQITLSRYHSCAWTYHRHQFCWGGGYGAVPTRVNP